MKVLRRRTPAQDESDVVGVKIGTAFLAAVRPADSSPRSHPNAGPIIRDARIAVDSSTITGFVDRVGDSVPVIFPNGKAYSGAELVARAIKDVIREGNASKAAVGVAVPAQWSDHQCAQLTVALKSVGIDDVTTVSSSLAALVSPTIQQNLPIGNTVICDVGARRMTVSLVACTDDSPEEVLQISSDVLNGSAVDWQLFDRIAADARLELGPAQEDSPADLVQLRAACCQAKEELSDNMSTTVSVDVSGTPLSVRITRADFADLIRQSVEAAVELVAQIFSESKNLDTPPRSVLLIGGGASIPLLAETLSRRLRVPVIRDEAPALTACWGAADLVRRNRD